MGNIIMVIYPNEDSTSLLPNIQKEILHSDVF